jgi:protein TonB
VGKKNKQSNRVMQTMLAFSIIIHVFIFMHVADIYKSEALSYIELSLEDISKPFRRAIPRPRQKHQAPKVNEVKKIDSHTTHIPKITPIDTDTKESINEQITMPDTASLSSGATDWQSAFADTGQYLTKKDYIDMLRLKIESRRKYPEKARNRHIQGRVLVGFSLSPSGHVLSATIIKSSRHPELDHAALNAVKTASPFPRPPASLFSGTLNMQITIVFELT